jgi:hypothetical protein
MKLVAAVVFLLAQFTFAQLPTNTIPDCIGVNIHFTDPRPGEMKMLADAGFRWVRMDFSWAAIETKPGQYDFSAYDRLLAALDEHHVRALLILDYANPLYDKNESPHSDEAVAAFAKWTAASATHFKGRGVIWEMYNEPNGFWRPHPDVQQYIKLAAATGKAIKSATPDELHIGPGVSGFDPAFMEACLQAGLLQYWDAVSVHPYGQDEPETRGEPYRELRAMVEKYKPKGKTIPILSGEWGFSSVWNSFTPELQGKYLPREFLFNCWQNLPLSIWYDWHDDGEEPNEPEHHFGTVLHNYDPKPAYIAAKTMTTQLGGFAFNKRLALAKPDEFMLLFSKGDEVRVAAWTSSSEPRKVNLPASPGAFSIVSHLGESLPKLNADENGLPITLTDSVQYLTPDAPNDLLRVAAAWERLPLEMMIQWPAHATVRPVLDNPLDRPLEVIRQNGTRDSVAPHRILRDAIMFDTLRQPIAIPRRVQYRIEGLGEIAQEMQVSISNPLIIIPLAPTGDVQPVRVDNPSGEAASLLVRRAGGSDGAKLDFATNQTTKLVDLPGDGTKDIEIYSADGGQLEATAHAPRFVPLSLDPTHFEIRAEGDGNVKSTQSFAEAPAPPGAPVKFETSLRIDYTFDAGWKYALLKPRGAAAKIDGKPIALAFWLKGDGSGNIPRVRFADSTGQTFQPDGERLVYKDWRYVSYSLDGSGAGRWGGAADGVVHYPIRLDTLLLIDSAARQATSGSVHIAAPALIYPR